MLPKQFNVFCYISILFVLLVKETSADDHLIYKSEVNGVKLDEVQNYWTDEFSIAFMQEDRIHTGSILMATHKGFWSLDQNKMLTEVADFRDMASRGVGSVSSFAQHNDTALILVDDTKSCLHWFTRNNPLSDRPTFTISHLAGLCSDTSRFHSADGEFDRARFNQPQMIVRGPPMKYFISEPMNGDGVIKCLDFESQTVTVFLKNEFLFSPPWRSPHALTVINNITMYISTEKNLYSVHFDGRVEGLTAGVRNVKDGPLAESEFVSSHALVGVSKDVMLVLPASGIDMRVIDLRNELVSTVELPTDRLLACAVNIPSQNKIYFGGQNGISVMSYEIAEVEPVESGASYLRAVTPLLTFVIANLWI